MIRTTALLALAAAATTSLAQVAITVDIDQPVLLPGESTTVTLFAGFDPSDYAMAGVETNLLTSVGSDGWSAASVLAPMDGPGTSDGVPVATGYNGILAGQLHFPVGAGIYANDTNPIAFWQATYTAPADVSTPFIVDISTLTRRYDVYFDRSSSASETRLDVLVEGSGTITVIPAPASAVVLAVGAACVRRRR